MTFRRSACVGSRRRSESKFAKTHLGLPAQPRQAVAILLRKIGRTEQPIAMRDDALLALEHESEYIAREGPA
ncbi:putative acetyl-CoA acyltransferase [Bradyrhizobium cosmicum]|uniref:Acetyl-CoA acyltransferase n=1 Tax=Bradyrhizobium cosmicum TaxID=1404864 RepID=A0AAI8QE37_9BRAD|nr:putative acetyl-CoA acyltransferase [Bradyrhizobium cosmicum]